MNFLTSQFAKSFPRVDLSDLELKNDASEDAISLISKAIKYAKVIEIKD